MIRSSALIPALFIALTGALHPAQRLFQSHFVVEINGGLQKLTGWLARVEALRKEQRSQVDQSVDALPWAQVAAFKRITVLRE